MIFSASHLVQTYSAFLLIQGPWTFLRVLAFSAYLEVHAFLTYLAFQTPGSQTCRAFFGTIFGHNLGACWAAFHFHREGRLDLGWAYLGLSAACDGEMAC